MSATARSAALVAVHAALITLGACGARQIERPDRSLVPDAATRDGSTQDAAVGLDAAEAGASPAPGCRTRQAARTYVGFAPGNSLDQFEATAAEAERVLEAVKRQLCMLGEAQDPEGSLRAAAAAGVLEITAVQFTSADLSTAQVRVQVASDAAELDAGGAPASWQLELVREREGWRISASARE